MPRTGEDFNDKRDKVAGGGDVRGKVLLCTFLGLSRIISGEDGEKAQLIVVKASIKLDESKKREKQSKEQMVYHQVSAEVRKRRSDQQKEERRKRERRTVSKFFE